MNVSYINVFVSDFPKALEYYKDVLKLPLDFSSDAHGYASFLAGPVKLGVAKTDDATLFGRHTGIGFATENLDQTHLDMVQRGVAFTMPPTVQPWGGYMAIFQDPDGNTYYLDQVSVLHG